MKICAPEGKKLKVHWTVLEAKPGKMSDMAEISSRTAALYTPNEPGSYALYGAIDSQNPVEPVILEQKEAGHGSKVLMTLAEVRPGCLEEFRAAITYEMSRAVSDDAGVFVMCATAETRDKAYRQKSDKLLKSRKVFENLPANITLK